MLYGEQVKKLMMIQKNHWRRWALTLKFVLALVIVQAQYNITAMLPSGSIYMRSQLWALSVSNTSRSPVEGKLQMEVKDLYTHETILSAVSGTFTIAPGVKAVESRAIQPVQYNGSTVVTDRSPNGFLPVGHYRVCYQLFIILHNISTLAADDCEQIEIEPLSPPVLTMPENDSVVTTLTPNFTWAPPAPTAMFTNLNYDFLLSEIYEGQSINDAIQKNLPLQQAQGLQQPFLTYPLQGPQLEKGKRYVWQIIAKDQQKFAVRSEAWTFRVGTKKVVPAVGNAVYLLMDERSGSAATIEPGVLHIKYVSSVQAQQIPVVFKDENGTVITTVKQQIKQGDNFLDITLGNRFQHNRNYTVVITDSNGRTSALTFTIK